MAKEEESDSIYEARDEKIVSPKDGKSTIRIGRFLKPCVRSSNQAVKVPNIPLLSEIFHWDSKEWPSKVHFIGWRFPQKKWDEWLDKLAEKYGSFWNQAGICDAIMSSRYEIRCNKDLVLGLVEFWCPETNTFVFPWGEATITLEDIMILGGFPVLGETVISNPRTNESVRIEEEMEKLRKEVTKSSKAKKAGHDVWLKYFMENESDFEHEAFLSLWLSRYVFPSLPEITIGNHVFPIAGRLSRGTQIALAPAVLASLYHNLRLLKEKAVTSVDSIPVLGLFQLVQLWAFERFPFLGLMKCPNPLNPGEPRVARWHKLHPTVTLPLIRSLLRSLQNFQWRPYAADLKNWCHLPYYKENEQLVIDCSSLDVEKLKTFVQFLCASDLVGLDCTEKYMPHRVAMQFGMDQDLPGEFSDVNFTKGNVKFFIPPRSFEPGVSVRYSIWWKESISAREEAIKEILKLERSSNGTKKSQSVQAKLSEYFNAFDATKTPKNRGREASHVVTRSAGKKSHSKPNYAEYSSEEEDTPPSPKFAQASLTNRKVKSDLQSFGSENKEADSHNIPTAVSIQENSQKKEVSPNMFEISSDDDVSLDNIPISENYSMRVPRNNSAKSTSTSEAFTVNESKNVASAPTENIRKRKLSSVAEGNKHNIPSSVNNGAKKVKVEAGDSENDPSDFAGPRKEIKRHNGSAKGGSEEGEDRKAGGSVNNPICIDDYMQATTTTTQKLGLEERIQKLEKLLGLKTK